MRYLLDKGVVLLEKKYKQIKQSQVYNKGSSASATLKYRRGQNVKFQCVPRHWHCFPQRPPSPSMCCTSPSPQARKAKVWECNSKTTTTRKYLQNQMQQLKPFKYAAINIRVLILQMFLSKSISSEVNQRAKNLTQHQKAQKLFSRSC